MCALFCICLPCKLTDITVLKWVDTDSSQGMYHRQRTGGPAGLPPTTISGIGGNEELEEQNSAAENELKDKVGLLKSLAIDIGTEVKEHNKLLNDADDAFDSVGGLLGTTIGKVRHLAKSGYRYYILYLFLFSIFVFLVLWFYI